MSPCGGRLRGLFVHETISNNVFVLFCFVFLHYTRYQEDFPSCKTIKRDAMTTALLDGSLKTMTKNRQEQEQK